MTLILQTNSRIGLFPMNPKTTWMSVFSAPDYNDVIWIESIHRVIITTVTRWRKRMGHFCHLYFILRLFTVFVYIHIYFFTSWNAFKGTIQPINSFFPLAKRWFQLLLCEWKHKCLKLTWFHDIFSWYISLYFTEYWESPLYSAKVILYWRRLKCQICIVFPDFSRVFF